MNLGYYISSITALNSKHYMWAASMFFKHLLKINISPSTSSVAVIPTNSSWLPAELFLIRAVSDIFKETTADNLYLLVSD